MIERVFAATVFAACAVLLLRLAAPTRWRYRFDIAVQRIGLRFRKLYASLRGLRASRRNAANAARVADEAIQRARGRGEWDGNVYKPKSFRKPPRDKMH